MTIEDKELLIRDLCARLPYGVICYDEVQNETGRFKQFEYEGLGRIHDGRGLRFIENIKPYLHPMSSMSEDERKDWFKYSCVDYDCEFKPEPTLYVGYCHLSVDWLNEHHFDYRGLIEKGLALEAPEGEVLSQIANRIGKDLKLSPAGTIYPDGNFELMSVNVVYE